MQTGAAQKARKSQDEIVGEIRRLVFAESPRKAQALSEVQFAPSRRFATGDGELDAQSNWQLIILPPVSADLFHALNRAALAVQQRWDMVDAFHAPAAHRGMAERSPRSGSRCAKR
ncbi:hypothetical protein GT347_25900 [Xylophilus rhododendri]|uniref:Uncharacterized protein n=2 Tax=Xylophilus rhododendri TaxID=2697032 RepID=A0A857JB02_9BURK|nr:hypothetical protein GT347_25900 [Xylophilus rhododendri]